MGMLKEDVEESFLVGDESHSDDPNIFDETMSNIDFKNDQIQ